jgi:hypothetical protein
MNRHAAAGVLNETINSDRLERQSGHGGRNLTTHWTGARVSRSFIVELAIAGLNARPVNSGVRPQELN